MLEFQQLHYLFCQDLQHADLFGAQFFGLVREYTQRSGDEARFCLQRDGRIKANIANLPCDKGIVRKTGIFGGIFHYGPLAGEEDLGAHGILARANAGVHTPGTDLVLVLRADDIDHAERSATQLRGQPHEVLQSAHHGGIGKKSRIHCRVQAIFL
ncbi:hypothetical protein D3C73_1172710 [compost metagenome]